MGDEGKFDKELLMHLLGTAKKGGMRSEAIDELLGLVRHQAKIDKENSKKQLAQLQPNVPFQSQNPCGEIPLRRTGWKPNDQWPCFIEYETRGGNTIDQACREAQAIADEEEVPVRLSFNDTCCILYPHGQWKEAQTSWWEARQILERSRGRKQAKNANFSNFSKPYAPQDIQVVATMMENGVFVVDTETTGLTMQMLKSRAPKEGQDPEHFFKGLRAMLGDED